jgi:hypothetical protein
MPCKFGTISMIRLGKSSANYIEALAKPGFCSGGLRPPAVWLAISAVGDRRYRVLQAPRE